MNSLPDNRDLFITGLWAENPAMVKLLGLCPLLAISNTAINALGLGIATLVTLLISNTVVSVCRAWLLPAIRIPLYVLVIATTVSCIELLMQAWLPLLHQSLGIFLPLIVTNCLIMGRAEAFASRQPVKSAIVDALSMGLGFLLVLVLLGMTRELIGFGSLFNGADQLFGPIAATAKVTFFSTNHGVLIALLPPGAFFILAGILIAKNHIDHQRDHQRDQRVAKRANLQHGKTNN